MQDFLQFLLENTVTFLGVEPDPLSSDNVVATNVIASSTMELQVVVPTAAVSGAVRIDVDTEMTTSSQIFTVLLPAEPSNLIDISTLGAS